MQSPILFILKLCVLAAQIAYAFFTRKKDGQPPDKPKRVGPIRRLLIWIRRRK
jgi:hypothetical protein